MKKPDSPLFPFERVNIPLSEGFRQGSHGVRRRLSVRLHPILRQEVLTDPYINSPLCILLTNAADAMFSTLSRLRVKRLDRTLFPSKKLRVKDGKRGSLDSETVSFIVRFLEDASAAMALLRILKVSPDLHFQWQPILPHMCSALWQYAYEAYKFLPSDVHVESLKSFGIPSRYDFPELYRRDGTLLNVRLGKVVKAWKAAAEKEAAVSHDEKGCLSLPILASVVMASHVGAGASAGASAGAGAGAGGCSRSKAGFSSNTYYYTLHPALDVCDDLIKAAPDLVPEDMSGWQPAPITFVRLLLAIMALEVTSKSVSLRPDEEEGLAVYGAAASGLVLCDVLKRALHDLKDFCRAYSIGNGAPDRMQDIENRFREALAAATAVLSKPVPSHEKYEIHPQRPRSTVIDEDFPSLKRHTKYGPLMFFR
jgi:hypothetical protein